MWPVSPNWFEYLSHWSSRISDYLFKSKEAETQAEYACLSMCQSRIEKHLPTKVTFRLGKSDYGIFGVHDFTVGILEKVRENYNSRGYYVVLEQSSDCNILHFSKPRIVSYY